MDNIETRTLTMFNTGDHRVDDTLWTINAMNNNFGLLYDEIQRLKAENANIKAQLDMLTNKEKLK
jgi:uncharacterized small protein (DUF1192 family)